MASTHKKGVCDNNPFEALIEEGKVHTNVIEFTKKDNNIIKSINNFQEK